MRIKKFVGFIISLISILGINFIPLEMWLYRDFSGKSAMFFYAVGNFSAIIFSVVFVLIFAPKQEQNPDYQRRNKIQTKNPAFPIVKIRQRKEILQNYLIFSLGFSTASGIFLLAFIFLILKKHIQFEEIITAIWWILGFQLLEFFGDFLMLRPLSLAQTEVFLKGSMGKIALLFLSVFMGIFLALFVNKWFVVPFIILKTLGDIIEQLGFLSGFNLRNHFKTVKSHTIFPSL